MKSAYEELLETEEGRLALCEEHAMAQVGELVSKLLEKSGMNRTEFAEKLNVTPGRITQLLDGEANMTLATVARMLNAFGQVVEISSRAIDDFGMDAAFDASSMTELDCKFDPGLIQTMSNAPARLAGASTPFAYQYIGDSDRRTGQMVG